MRLIEQKTSALGKLFILDVVNRNSAIQAIIDERCGGNILRKEGLDDSPQTARAASGSRE
jgi:hypothetical protein